MSDTHVSLMGSNALVLTSSDQGTFDQGSNGLSILKSILESKTSKVFNIGAEWVWARPKALNGQDAIVSYDAINPDQSVVCNTSIFLMPKASTGYYGPQVLFYNRVDLSKYNPITIAGDASMSDDQLIAKVNEKTGLGFDNPQAEGYSIVKSEVSPGLLNVTITPPQDDVRFVKSFKVPVLTAGGGTTPSDYAAKLVFTDPSRDPSLPDNEDRYTMTFASDNAYRPFSINNLGPDEQQKLADGSWYLATSIEPAAGTFNLYTSLIYSPSDNTGMLTYSQVNTAGLSAFSVKLSLIDRDASQVIDTATLKVAVEVPVEDTSRVFYFDRLENSNLFEASQVDDSVFNLYEGKPDGLGGYSYSPTTYMYLHVRENSAMVNALTSDASIVITDLYSDLIASQFTVHPMQLDSYNNFVIPIEITAAPLMLTDMSWVVYLQDSGGSTRAQLSTIVGDTVASGGDTGSHYEVNLNVGGGYNYGRTPSFLGGVGYGYGYGTEPLAS